jgi:hypothetical protein
MRRYLAAVLLALAPNFLLAKVPNPTQRKAIKQAERLGKAIYEQDMVAAQATDALRTQVSIERESRVKGWVVTSRGTTSLVSFVGELVDGHYVLYEVELNAGKAPVVTVLKPPRELHGAALTMFLARQAAFAAMPSACSERYNTIVLPGKIVKRDGWLVYLLAATTEQGQVLVGGHFRADVSAEGRTVRSIEPLANTCLTLDLMDTDSEPVAALFMTQVLTDTPIETHVFLNLLHKVDFYVITEPGIWGITDGQIRYVGPRPEAEEK